MVGRVLPNRSGRNTPGTEDEVWEKNGKMSSRWCEICDRKQVPKGDRCVEDNKTPIVPGVPSEYREFGIPSTRMLGPQIGTGGYWTGNSIRVVYTNETGFVNRKGEVDQTRPNHFSLFRFGKNLG